MTLCVVELNTKKERKKPTHPQAHPATKAFAASIFNLEGTEKTFLGQNYKANSYFKNLLN